MSSARERELQEETQRLRSLVDIAEVLLVSLARDGTITDLNRTACVALGASREDLVGRDWFATCLPDAVQARVRRVFEEALTGGPRADSYVNEIRTLDGRRRTIAWHNRFAPEGVAPGVVSISSGLDITERLAAENALRDSERRYREIVQTTDQGVWIIDQEGRTQFANARMAEMLGCSVDELHSSSMFDFMTDEWRAIATRNLQRRREGEREHHEFTFRRSDGSELHTWITTNPIVDGDGEVVGALGMITDVTEQVRARAEEERLRAQVESMQRLESLGVLAGGVAHDFNNLLAGMLGNAELARQELVGVAEEAAAEACTRLDAVVEAAERAARLTRRLLLVAGRGEPKVETLDLRQEVDALQRVVSAALGPRIRVDVHHDDERPLWVEGDHDRLQQLVMNLLMNAGESYADDGEVHVRVLRGTRERGPGEVTLLGADRELGEAATLEVADVGCGMDRETRERMLDPFFSTKGAGRGLGMSTSLGFLRAHDARFYVATEPGRGTTIRVELPVAAAPREPEAEPPESVRFVGRILVVDDEPLVRDLAAKVLRRHAGHAVEVVGSGREALVRSDAGERYDAMVLDLSMPDLDGEATLREFRARGHGEPVLVCSGYLEHDVMRRFEELSPVGFLHKPYRPQELVEALAEVRARATRR